MVQCPRQARLHGATWTAQYRCHFRFGELEKVAIGDGQSFIFPQRLYSDEQLLTLSCGDGQFLGREIIGWPECCQPQRMLCLSPGCPPPVLRLVRHNAEQPGAKWLGGTKPSQSVERFNEPFLGTIFRLGGHTNDQVGCPKSYLLIALDQLLIGRNLASLRPAYQFSVVQGFSSLQ